MPYHHFTPNEQYVIAHMTIAGFSLREIGRRLGRHHTSIGREIRRNRPTYADDAVYWYDAAEFYAKERRHRARHRRRHHQRLAAYIISKLRLDWPPQAIAGRLRVDYPDDEAMRISHELFCRSLCSLAAGNQSEYQRPAPILLPERNGLQEHPGKRSVSKVSKPDCLSFKTGLPSEIQF